MSSLAILRRRLKTLRQKGGLTQETLAHRANISTPYVTHIEAGNRTPSLDVIDSLAAALQCEPWELLTDRRLPPDPYRRLDPLLSRALLSLPHDDLELILDIARHLAFRR